MRSKKCTAHIANLTQPYTSTYKLKICLSELSKYFLFFRLTKYQHLFFVQLLAQILAPIALVLTLVCNIVRFYQTGPATDYNNDKDALDWLEILVLNPITSALPMVSLSFPLYWNVANYIALAKIMNDYLSFRHVHVTEDPFDDTPGM